MRDYIAGCRCWKLPVRLFGSLTWAGFGLCIEFSVSNLCHISDREHLCRRPPRRRSLTLSLRNASRLRTLLPDQDTGTCRTTVFDRTGQDIGKATERYVWEGYPCSCTVAEKPFMLTRLSLTEATARDSALPSSTESRRGYLPREDISSERSALPWCRGAQFPYLQQMLTN